MERMTDRIEARLTAVERGLEGLRAEANARFDEVSSRAEMNARFDEVPTRAEMNARFDEVPTRTEMNARFDEMEERFTSVDRRLEVLVEDQRSATQLLAEGIAAIGERMERGFAEVRELFAGQQRFWEAAFQNHEQRLRRLEERG